MKIYLLLWLLIHANTNRTNRVNDNFHFFIYLLHASLVFYCVYLCRNGAAGAAAAFPRAAGLADSAQFTGAAAVFVSHLNIFVLWSLLLLTIGFTAAAGIPRVKAFACAAGYQAALILINLGLIKLGQGIIGGMF
jgi:hypothetical protein